MKKFGVLILVLSLVFGVTVLVMAGFQDSNMGKGLTKSPAFENDSEDWSLNDHFTHKNLTPRFDTEKGNIAIKPTQPGENSSENSAVKAHSGIYGPCSLIKTDKNNR
mgnify:CR=1 FL=1